MSQKAIRWIICLMSASLIGIIAFQSYWLLLSLNEKEKEFDQTIAEVLAKVDENMQNLEASSFIKSFDIKKDSDFKFISKGKTQDERIVIKQSIKDSNLVIKDIKKKINDISLNANAIVFTSTSTSNLSSTLDSLKTEAQVLQLYQNKKNKLTEIVDKLSLEFAFDIKSLEERIEGINLSELIEGVLKDYGINELDYSIQLKDIELDTIIYGDSLSGAENSSTYERLIFEENGPLKGGLLRFNIPDKTGYLIQALWLQLIVSLLLTAVLIYTFFYTVSSIIKQKKIAQIKSDFINNMTHEFKTPVATISLAIDSMLHKDVRNNDTELDRYGEIIKRENQRMNSQIERLLEMALFDREEIVIDFERIDVHQIIKELQSDYRLKIDLEEGALKLSLNANQFMVHVDRLHFYNVLRNLVDNAIKYSSKTCLIEIITHNNAKDFVVEVKDNGIGMDQSTMEKIFDRFYRKTSGNLHETKGFGLGLSYANEILKKMNGSISVKSQLNEGSIFTIKIPISHD